MHVWLKSYIILCWYWWKNHFSQNSIFWHLEPKRYKFCDIFTPHPSTPDISSLHSQHLILPLFAPPPRQSSNYNECSTHQISCHQETATTFLQIFIYKMGYIALAAEFLFYKTWAAMPSPPTLVMFLAWCLLYHVLQWFFRSLDQLVP